MMSHQSGQYPLSPDADRDAGVAPADRCASALFHCLVAASSFPCFPLLDRDLELPDALIQVLVGGFLPRQLGPFCLLRLG